MKRKGFTLIELLGVIVILGLVAAFSVPALTKTFKGTADKQYEEFTKSITLAAENYFHNELDGDLSTKRFITIGDLVKKGYLKKDINPLTEKEVSESSTVVVSKNTDGTESYVFVDRNVTETGYNRDGLLVYFDGYHNFENGQWIDLSGKGNNGTVYGAIWDKNHVYFDGVDDWVHIGEHNYNSITMEFVAEIFQNDKLIFGNPENGGCYISSTSILTVGCYSGSYKTINYNSAELGKKYNVSLVLDEKAKTMTLYVNGINVGSEIVDAFTYPIANTHLVLGANPYGSGVSHNFFQGNVYSVRYYNKALTHEQVINNYMVDKYRFGLE